MTISSWTYEERVVAFVDVLGYKALTSMPDQACQHTVALISKHLAASRYDAEVNGFITKAGRHFSARLFSDCICMSDEVSGTGCRNVVIQVAELAQNLTRNGIYVRGGVSIGRHFQDVNIVFGEGIVRAYEIEHVRAKVPRVVLEVGIAERLPADVVQLVSTDVDGELFVDFWRFWKWDHAKLDMDLQLLSAQDRHAGILEAFREAKAALERNLVSGAKSPSSVRKKLKWLAQYQNTRASELLDPQDASAVVVRTN